MRHTQQQYDGTCVRYHSCIMLKHSARLKMQKKVSPIESQIWNDNWWRIIIARAVHCLSLLLVPLVTHLQSQVRMGFYSIGCQHGRRNNSNRLFSIVWTQSGTYGPPSPHIIYTHTHTTGHTWDDFSHSLASWKPDRLFRLLGLLKSSFLWWHSIQVSSSKRVADGDDDGKSSCYRWYFRREFFFFANNEFR